MRFSRILLALVTVGLASAQIPDLPPCSLECFISALANDGCKPLTNFACHCQQPGLVTQVQPCVKQACDKAAQSSVSSIVVSECSEAGHPVSIPPVGRSSVTTAAVQTTSDVGVSTTETGVAVSTETAPATGTTAMPTETGGSIPSRISATDTVSDSASTTGATSSPVIPSGGGSPSGSSSVPVSGSVSGSGSSMVPTGSASASGPVFSGVAANPETHLAGIIGVAIAVIAGFGL